MEQFLVYGLLVLFFAGLVFSILVLVPSETSSSTQQGGFQGEATLQTVRNGEMVMSYIFIVVIFGLFITLAIFAHKEGKTCEREDSNE